MWLETNFANLQSDSFPRLSLCLLLVLFAEYFLQLQISRMLRSVLCLLSSPDIFIDFPACSLQWTISSHTTESLKRRWPAAMESLQPYEDGVEDENTFQPSHSGNLLLRTQRRLFRGCYVNIRINERSVYRCTAWPALPSCSESASGYACGIFGGILRQYFREE